MAKIPQQIKLNIPLVSIVTVVYNDQERLEQTILSVTNNAHLIEIEYIMGNIRLLN